MEKEFYNLEDIQSSFEDTFRELAKVETDDLTDDMTLEEIADSYLKTGEGLKGYTHIGKSIKMFMKNMHPDNHHKIMTALTNATDIVIAEMDEAEDAGE